MSKIIKRALQYPTSDAVKRLNPGVFRNAEGKLQISGEMSKKLRDGQKMAQEAAKGGFKSDTITYHNHRPESALGHSGAITRHSSNDLSGKFLSIWQLLNGPKLETEFRFHPERKFRCDFCHLATRTCIEIEGGIFSKHGGHSSVTGILRDIDKYNELTFLGFRLFRFHGKEGVAGSIDVANLTRLIRFLERKKI